MTGAISCGAACPRRAGVPSRSSSERRTPRRPHGCSCREPGRGNPPFAGPGEPDAGGGSRRRRSRGASRQMRFPVPTATVASTISSLPWAASTPTPATRHSAPAADSSRAVAALPSELCAVEHKADAKPALSRANQRPAIRRAHLVDRGVDAVGARCAISASAPSRLRPGRASTSARSRRRARADMGEGHIGNARPWACPRHARCPWATTSRFQGSYAGAQVQLSRRASATPGGAA